jgi:hypothetical protein
MSSAGNKPESEDPQQLYNRDREQMERSLDALRRAIKTDASSQKRDVGKMMREGVLLTKELNTLRKDWRGMQLQKNAIDQLGGNASKTNINDLLDILGITIKKPTQKPSSAKVKSSDPNAVPPTPPSEHAIAKKRDRTSAIRTTSAHGRVDNTSSTGISKSDHWEVWRELQMQQVQMTQLEQQLTNLCNSVNIDPVQALVNIDASQC